jgi:hypothetical protein
MAYWIHARLEGADKDTIEMLKTLGDVRIREHKAWNKGKKLTLEHRRKIGFTKVFGKHGGE